jgi:hypothetical protein
MNPSLQGLIPKVHLASKLSLQSFFVARAAACLVLLQLREITNHDHTLLGLD